MNDEKKSGKRKAESGSQKFRLLASGLRLLTSGFCFLALAALAQTVSPFNLPLYFEANQSQTEFLSRGSDYQFLISSAGAQILLRKTIEKMAAVKMQFIGANARAQIHGGTELPGKINYLTGNDSTKWRTGLPTFAKVLVAGIYPGVNLIYHGNQRRLEYDFTVAPGANPNAIKIHFAGAEKISINAQGELVLKVGGDEIRQPKPEIFQTIAGARREISSGYKILNARAVAFEIGDYNHSLPLVIDPVLSYSTYFGGTAGDTACAVALDTNDFSIYIAGQTLSKQFFTNGPPFSTPGAFQANFAGGTLNGDAFVARFDNSGTNLEYLTYLGGSADEEAYAIAVDGSGDAFVTGYTVSPDFPTTAGTISPHINGQKDPEAGYYPADVFVAELNPGGSNLIYSTYLGGQGPDAAEGIALDSAGDAYIAGLTCSPDFPTMNALQKHLACTNSLYYNANAFVSEISPKGTNLLYSTYLGGTNYDGAMGIAIDGSNYVYVAGYTASTNFPVWRTPTNLSGAHWLNGATGNKGSHAFDAFVAKFPPLNTSPPTSITNLVYSFYLGGTNNDMASGIAADALGNAYVTGNSSSTNFPHFSNANVPGLYSFVATNENIARVATNVFLTKISSNGSNIVYSVLFGGKISDIGYGVAVDSIGQAFVVGAENSTNFPAANTSGFLRATNSGASDVFVTAFNTNCSALLYSVQLGGKGNDYGYGIALDPADNAYVVGRTLSTNFPTLDARQTFRNGTNDAFLAKILFSATNAPLLSVAPGDPGVTLGKPAWFPEFQLETTTNLTSTNWMTVPVPSPLVFSNGDQLITLPATNSAAFFQLHKF